MGDKGKKVTMVWISGPLAFWLSGFPAFWLSSLPVVRIKEL
jgi:hypothetical protein